MTGRYNPPLEERSIDDIKFRIKFIRLVIKGLKEDDKTKDDPRLPEWLDEHREILRDLNRELTRRNRLGGKPETVEINLRPASLIGRVPGGKNG